MRGCYEGCEKYTLPVQRENLLSLSNMVKEREQLAEAILNHALEIICLLTVEDFIVVKRPDGTRCSYSICATDIESNGCDSPSGCPELSFTLLGMEDKTQKMIVELANKVVRLLAREVPLKCEDVAIYFSNDEKEYLKGHGEQSKNNLDTCIVDQPTAPLQQSTEKNDPINLCIKEEREEEPHHSAEQPTAPVQQSTEQIHPIKCRIKEEPDVEPHRVTESPQFVPSPDQEHVYITDHIKEEAEESQDLYMSVSEDPVSPAECTFKDEEYLPPKTNKKRSRTHKSRLGKTSFSCKVCGKVLGSKWTLDKHLLIHTGQRPFPCNECEKSFSCKNHLDAHKRSHTGERPFPCNQCDRRFFNQQHLVLHQVVHTGEKPYSCPVCGKGFTRQSSVVKHSGMHAEQKPFVCNECGKSYCQYASLVVHQRQHSGEKPFVCKYCEKAFPCKDTMLKHQRAHTGEKPFACPQCNKRFIDKSSMTKHKRKVHAKEPKPANWLGMESDQILVTV
ncbi:uncharacterized protein [Aquarana catesbeiana]|uniref:uncharacterized protein isoform X3 n=1 Tax=Aquarana catesbeiana TaxID=8400 RepID=UPI003CCA1147